MAMIFGLAAVGLATAVIFGYLVFIWWLDRYEREPFWMVLLVFFWGAFIATAGGCIMSLAMSVPASMVIPSVYDEFFAAVIAAPLAEEFTKALVFAVLLLTPHVDNETDGLIYGAAVGLGFAAVENLLYFLSAAAMGPDVLIATIVVRTLFTALVHTISSALFGYTLGYVRHRKLLPWLWTLPVIGFSLAVANHALWNLLAVVSESGLVGEVMTMGTIGLGISLVVIMSIALFAMTQFSLAREHKIIARYLCDEAQRGVLPSEHAEIIPYWSKRRKKNWLPPGIPHQDYVEAATLLAFRRYQKKTAAPRFKGRYGEQVAACRRKVRELLSRSQGVPSRRSTG